MAESFGKSAKVTYATFELKNNNWSAIGNPAEVTDKVGDTTRSSLTVSKKKTSPAKISRALNPASPMPGPIVTEKKLDVKGPPRIISIDDVVKVINPWVVLTARITGARNGKLSAGAKASSGFPVNVSGPPENPTALPSAPQMRSKLYAIGRKNENGGLLDELIGAGIEVFKPGNCAVAASGKKS